MDYNALAQLLLGQGLVQPVGDVIPFQRRQGLMSGPEMGGSRQGYGGGGSVTKLTKAEAPKWEVYANNGKFDKRMGPFSREEAGRIHNQLKARGIDAHSYLGTGKPVTQAEKYQQALALQRFLGKQP